MNTARNVSFEYQQLALQAQHLAQKNQRLAAGRCYRLAGEKAAAVHAIDEALDYLTRALAVLPDGAVEQRYGGLLAREAVLAEQGDRSAQEEDLISLAVLADSLDDDRERARIAMRVAGFKEATGLYQDAVSVGRLAVRLAQLANDPATEFQGRIIWGRNLAFQGAAQPAAGQLSKALQVAETLGQPQLVAESHRTLGGLALNKGEREKARQHYESALPLCHQIGDHSGECHLLNYLGRLAYVDGRLSEALTHWLEALALCRQIGDLDREGSILGQLGMTFADLGQYEEARRWYEASHQVCARGDLGHGEAKALIGLSRVSFHLENIVQADNLAREGLFMAETMGDRRLQGQSLSILAHIQMAQKQWAQAQASCWDVLALSQETEDEWLAQEAQALRAAISLAAGDSERAAAQIAPIMAHLATGPEPEDGRTSLTIYLTCYQVLAADQDPRAPAVLEAAQQRLQARASLIGDESARRSFLENVRVNRAIMAAVEGGK